MAVDNAGFLSFAGQALGFMNSVVGLEANLVGGGNSGTAFGGNSGGGAGDSIGGSTSSEIAMLNQILEEMMQLLQMVMDSQGGSSQGAGQAQNPLNNWNTGGNSGQGQIPLQQKQPAAQVPNQPGPPPANQNQNPYQPVTGGSSTAAFGGGNGGSSAGASGGTAGGATIGANDAGDTQGNITPENIDQNYGSTIQQDVDKYNSQYGTNLTKSFVEGIIYQESKGDPKAESQDGQDSKGLMQMSTASGFDIADMLSPGGNQYDPSTSIDSGVHLLAIMDQSGNVNDPAVGGFYGQFQGAAGDLDLLASKFQGGPHTTAVNAYGNKISQWTQDFENRQQPS
jgi:hypothetical protein